MRDKPPHFLTSYLAHRRQVLARSGAGLCDDPYVGPISRHTVALRWRKTENGAPHEYSSPYLRHHSHNAKPTKSRRGLPEHHSQNVNTIYRASLPCAGARAVHEGSNLYKTCTYGPSSDEPHSSPTSELVRIQEARNPSQLHITKIRRHAPTRASNSSMLLSSPSGTVRGL